MSLVDLLLMFIAIAPPFDDPTTTPADAGGFIEIIVGELRVVDGVVVVLQAGRFEAAWDGLSAVEEDDGHAFASTSSQIVIALK